MSTGRVAQPAATTSAKAAADQRFTGLSPLCSSEPRNRGRILLWAPEAGAAPLKTLRAGDALLGVDCGVGMVRLPADRHRVEENRVAVLYPLRELRVRQLLTHAQRRERREVAQDRDFHLHVARCLPESIAHCRSGDRGDR